MAWRTTRRFSTTHRKILISTQAVAWPLEVAKNKKQGADGMRGSTLAIVRQLAASDGLRGLYRGFLPGALRSFVANGAGMAVFQFTQSLRKD